MPRPFKCPYCSKTKSIWKGYRDTKEGRVRLRQCGGCRRKWTTGRLEPRARRSH